MAILRHANKSHKRRRTEKRKKPENEHRKTLPVEHILREVVVSRENSRETFTLEEEFTFLLAHLKEGSCQQSGTGRRSEQHNPCKVLQ
jgi:hypothetical protein